MPKALAFALSALLIVAGAAAYLLGGDSPSEEATSSSVEVLAAQIPPEVELPLGSGPMMPTIPPEEEQALLVDVVARVAATTTTTIAAPREKSSSPAPKPPSVTTTTAAPVPPPTTTTAEFRADYENQFFSNINSLRAANGRPALTRNGSLNTYARDWAKTLAGTGKLKHSNIRSLVPPWQGAGENLGMGSFVDQIFSLLVSSGEHLRIMLGNYTSVGIGVYQDANGVLWTVHVYGR